MLKQCIRIPMLKLFLYNRCDISSLIQVIKLKIPPFDSVYKNLLKKEENLAYPAMLYSSPTMRERAKCTKCLFINKLAPFVRHLSRAASTQ